MPIESGADLIIALLYAPGNTGKPSEEIRGITRLEKLLFLLLKEAGFEKKTSGELVFEAYDFGPYSGEVVDILDALKADGLVAGRVEELQSYSEVVDGLMVSGRYEESAAEKPRTVEIYALTERGKRVGDALFTGLAPEERRALQSIKKRFNAIELNELLEYVYKRYPGMIRKSKILDKILGFGSRPDLPAFEHGE
jgi:uncharacterized protein YwgA